ncbi:PTS sugar transporter subunit IIB [Anaerorhabdus sp.]|uniref:PTS EIIB type-2 domain-containing protein n=1 Tax=bioreactor metagenome TaxID=1076179 RepID=A0A645EJY1_9ZZZZ|nr:PTS sugar transporter subunit IIB [Anaerorhabdus sp.]MEA4875155.1 PTS sugar transporter subunit IIB [Anaerorhabdus sp.]
MYKGLVACRAGMGSSMLLKIKVEQVISEQKMDLQVEHGNLDSLVGFNGDVVITMEDVAHEIANQVPYAIGIRNIMDKEEIKAKLDEFFNSKK